MSRVLPILFNGDMVRAILDGCKTVTRRVIKPQPDCFDCGLLGDKCIPMRALDIDAKDVDIKPPYRPEDILYVRETWAKHPKTGKYYYRADSICNGHTIEASCPEAYDRTANCDLCEWMDGYIKWHPSIHMPKAAARIWLKVTDVRVERLQDITPADVVKEGAYEDCWECLESYSDSGNQCCYKQDDECSQCDGVITEWERLWNYTIKKPDQSRYGWNANPWVWVIEFERCGKPQEENG